MSYAKFHSYNFYIILWISLCSMNGWDDAFLLTYLLQCGYSGEEGWEDKQTQGDRVLLHLWTAWWDQIKVSPGSKKWNFNNISKHAFSEYISKVCYLTSLSTINFRQNEILYCILKYLLNNSDFVSTHAHTNRKMYDLKYFSNIEEIALAFDFWNIHLYIMRFYRWN